MPVFFHLNEAAGAKAPPAMRELMLEVTTLCTRHKVTTTQYQNFHHHSLFDLLEGVDSMAKCAWILTGL